MSPVSGVFSLQRNLVLNSPLFLVFGLTLASIAVLFAFAMQTWWLALSALPGLLIAFRLQRDAMRDRLAELTQREGFAIHRSGNEFFGVVGDFFLIGPADGQTLDAAVALMQRKERGAAFELSGAASDIADQSSGNSPARLQIWRLSDISCVLFFHGTGELRIVSQSGEYTHTFPNSGDRDVALRLLGRAVSWETGTQSRRVFAPNPMSTFLCLTFIFCAGVLVFGGFGLVNPGQLPLMTWKDFRVRNLHGRARGAIMIAALIGEACLFLFQNLHPVALVILGMTGIGGGCWLLREVLWPEVEDTTWTQVDASG
jgi:hypothetical protein